MCACELEFLSDLTLVLMYVCYSLYCRCFSMFKIIHTVVDDEEAVAMVSNYFFATVVCKLVLSQLPPGVVCILY